MQIEITPKWKFMTAKLITSICLSTLNSKCKVSLD